jgi:hypothetical protein
MVKKKEDKKVEAEDKVETPEAEAETEAPEAEDGTAETEAPQWGFEEKVIADLNYLAQKVGNPDKLEVNKE